MRLRRGCCVSAGAGMAARATAGARWHHPCQDRAPVALEAGGALGLDGGRGLVATRKAYGNRTLEGGLAQHVGLRT